MLRLLPAWAATTRNNDYLRMEGLKRLVGTTKHRKELVAGGLAAFLTAGASSPFLGQSSADLFVEYSDLVDRLGNHATDFWSSYFNHTANRLFQPMNFVRISLIELPQVGL
jgi:hypothetical protein